MPEPNLVPLFDPPRELTEMEAANLMSLLTSNGIEAVLVEAEMLPNLPSRIDVPSDQLKEARRIVEEALDAGPSAAEEGEAASEVQ